MGRENGCGADRAGPLRWNDHLSAGGSVDVRVRYGCRAAQSGGDAARPPLPARCCWSGCLSRSARRSGEYCGTTRASPAPPMPCCEDCVHSLWDRGVVVNSSEVADVRRASATKCRRSAASSALLARRADSVDCSCTRAAAQRVTEPGPQ
jgi:hypothetical protein